MNFEYVSVMAAPYLDMESSIWTWTVQVQVEFKAPFILGFSSVFAAKPTSESFGPVQTLW